MIVAIERREGFIHLRSIVLESSRIRDFVGLRNYVDRRCLDLLAVNGILDGSADQKTGQYSD
jgi:hypothetical protein